MCVSLSLCVCVCAWVCLRGSRGQAEISLSTVLSSHHLFCDWFSLLLIQSAYQSTTHTVCCPIITAWSIIRQPHVEWHVKIYTGLENSVFSSFILCSYNWLEPQLKRCPWDVISWQISSGVAVWTVFGGGGVTICRKSWSQQIELSSFQWMCSKRHPISQCTRVSFGTQ